MSIYPDWLYQCVIEEGQELIYGEEIGVSVEEDIIDVFLSEELLDICLYENEMEIELCQQ